ncbi:MAG: fatty acid--CoA ligase family protein, partial [Myxococcota bacterium]
RAADLEASRQFPRLRLGGLHFAAQPESSPSYEELVSRDPETRELPKPKPHDPAAIFFTSGTTGPPKGVTHSFESLGWLFASLIGASELSSEDVLLPGSSLSHMGAFMFSFGALAVGAPVVVPRSFDADELLPLLREYRPTVLNVLPSPLFRLVRDHGASHGDFTSLRLVRAAGDKVSIELEREFTELAGFPIDEGYGMTEVGIAALSPPSSVRPGSLGRPVPGFSFSIRNEKGNEVASGEEGRVWIRSRSCMVGYWNKPQATREAMRDGWLDTGDLMRADEEGYLWFRGRRKQIIIHDGSNICPQEVEEALLEHPALSGAAVVGVHDLLHGEDVRAYVSFRKEAEPPTAQELIQFARARVGYKAPEEIVVLDAIPMNVTGKVDRARIKNMAEADKAHPE